VGKIFAVYDIMPESTDVPLDNVVSTLKGIIPKGVELNNTKIEPVAFGLKKIVASFVIDDSIDGVGNLLEDAVRSIQGVENFECTSSALL
jgi:elongation factor 1-beta